MKSLTIFGTKIKVVKDDLIVHGILGKYSPTEQTIYIDKSLRGKEFISTLMHEIGHATFHVLGYHQTTLTLDMEELIVDNLSNVFCEVASEIKFGTESTKPRRTKKRNS